MARRIRNRLRAMAIGIRWSTAHDAVLLDLRHYAHFRTFRNLLTLLDVGGARVFLPLGRRAILESEALQFHPQIHWAVSRAHRGMTITDDPLSRLRPGDIRVVYDYAPHMLLPEGHVAAPYPMHPQIYAEFKTHRFVADYRAQRRTTTITFSGSFGKGYGSPGQWISREAIVQRASPRITLVDRCHQSRWLAQLAGANFFLAPPGVTIPVCHNIIEALAVGTIPITNYADWLTPPLVDGETCLTFSTLEQLDAALDRAQSMPPSSLAEMRRNAAAYYDAHVDPQRFMNRLRESIETLHVLDESAVAVQHALQSRHNGVSSWRHQPL